jgi:hypothetical protein
VLLFAFGDEYANFRLGSLEKRYHEVVFCTQLHSLQCVGEIDARHIGRYTRAGHGSNADTCRSIGGCESLKN